MALTLCIYLSLFLAAALGGSPPQGARIAITLDDVPWSGADPGDDSLAARTERIIEALKAHAAPATAFVVCGRLASSSRALDAWLEAGIELGNHSERHRDINATSLDAWTADVRTCDATLRRLTNRPPRYFRFPLLHQGPTVARRDSAAAALRGLGYEIAHVSIDNSEWILARAYREALAAGDARAAENVGAAFVTHILATLDHAREVSLRKLGRDIDHILLLHANALAADYLGDLLSALDERGVAYISLESALADPAYALTDGYAGPKGLSWLYRMEPATPEDAAWDDEEAGRIERALNERD